MLSLGDSLGVKGGDGIIGAIGPIMRGSINVGTQIDRWWEDNRKGTLGAGGVAQGYGYDRTHKEKAFAGLSWEFEGLKFRYYFEFLHKDQIRERDGDQKWLVFRSKASLEVNW